MATAGLNRMMLWGDLEGRELEQRWLLGRLVRPEGRTAWFEAIAPDGVPTMLSITEALNDEEELLAQLRAASEIRHPNVVAIREATISHLDDIPVVVAAMEMTEENLGDVLRDRLLSAAEGRQVLDAVLAALGTMHGHGLVHKHVEAASVLAMGETIKLRSDCVRMGGSAFGVAAADDVRGAARMATHAVTGRFPAGENDPVLQLLPEAMARAVRRALIGNAGATEVAALAGTRLELMPEIVRDATRIEPYSKAAMKLGGAAGAKEKTTPGDGTQLESAREKRPARKSEAKMSQEIPRVVAMRPAEERAQAALFDEPFMLPNDRNPRRMVESEPNEGKWPGAVYVIAAAIAVVLVTVFTLYGVLHREPEQRPVAPATSAAVAPAPAQAASFVAGSAPVKAASVSAEGWRVVAYTFNYEKTARERARDLAERFPQLNPQVFSPRGAEAWLVTVGGVMSQADAVVLRDKVVNLGLPEDTYAQNFR
jgi:eukaryotic-like serine/threonine-protein kinase